MVATTWSTASTVALVLFALAPVPANAQPDAGAIAAERAAALMASARVPGLSAAVARDGEVVWAAGFGWASVADRVRVTPSTVFGIGSVSKPLAAAALMRLAEGGRMDLDSPVQRYVPSFPDTSGQITLRRLAAHLGGIRHYEMRDFSRPVRPRTATDALSIFAGDALVAGPGTRHAYSSYGYVLLSAAMESATGQHFLGLMSERVFVPLGMRSTGVDLWEVGDAARAVQYAGCGGAACTPSPYADYGGTWAGGGFVSTAPDLARFGGALLRGGFLRPEMVEAMWTPQRTAAGEDTGYGIGWRVGRDRAGRGIVHHGGRTHQLRAFLLLYPEHGVAIAVLANGPADFAEEAVGHLAEPFLQMPWSRGGS